MSSLASTSRRLLLLALVVVVSLFSRGPDASGGEARSLVMLVNAKNVHPVSLASTKKMYLGESFAWPGNIPVNLLMRAPSAPATDVFLRTLQVSPARFKHVWQQKKRAGHVGPDSVPDIATMTARIANDEGAIGFAFADEVPAHAGGVRVIALR